MSKNKKAFISYSFKHRDEFRKVNDSLRSLLAKHEYRCCGFVFDYTSEFSSNREMMEIAMKEIAGSDLLIAEGSYKSLGVGIEAGFARAKGIPVLYLYRKVTEKSTTLEGIADEIVDYEDEDDLLEEVEKILKKIK